MKIGPPTATIFATHSGLGICKTQSQQYPHNYRTASLTDYVTIAFAAKTLGFMAPEPEWVVKIVAVGGSDLQVY